MACGMFFWLMVWRLLTGYGYGADARALAMLAVGACLFTAALEAGWIWAGRPACAFREVKASEREAFARFRDIYIGYSSAYRGV